MMGSSQSSTAPEQVSFSVDPSGKISYKIHNGDGNIQHGDQTTSNTKVQTSETLTEPLHLPNDDENRVAKQQDQPQLQHQQQLSTISISKQKAARSSDDLTLEETERVVSMMKAKYKPSENDVGKKMSALDEIEQNLLHCYAVNKNQPLKCSKVSQQYREYVKTHRNQLLRKSVDTPLMTTIIVIIACLLLHITTVSCFGAMSIDLGSEWMKVGLVAPNVQMDIVLNAQSQRKTAMAVAFANGERFIGDPALDIASKYPEKTYTHFLDLVGKTINHESVKHYKQRFPYADIASHEPNSTSIILNHPEGLNFTPLELVAMMIQHAHDQVTNRLNSNEPIYDVVITVPPFFNSIERKVIKDAARLAGLNVLRLTNVNSAFALSYGIFRHTDYKPELLDTTANLDNRTSILFFDQGASHTSVTLADYHLIEQIDDVTNMSKNESLPTVTIRAQVYDRYLGGLDMQLRLRDYLVKAFSKKTKIDSKRIYSRGRSASKILKESARVKKVLSANTETVARVENVIDDKDMKQPLSRNDFEGMNNDLMETRVRNLLDQLFMMPGVNRVDPIESVIIVGGNTRTPKIQQVLLDYFKLDNLGKSINADEGAALAALYQAASLGRGFRVKKFSLEEFGEEKRRYDPAKVVTTTTTPPPPSTEAGADTSTEAKPDETTTTPAPVQLTTPDPDAIYSETELNRISNKLSHLREQDFMRLQRLSLRNSIESLLGEGREKLSDGDEILVAKKDQVQKVLSEAYNWLEDGPEEEKNNVTLLADKYTELYDMIHPRPPSTVPPPPSADDLDLSKVLNNDTLNIFEALNLTNPFASMQNETSDDKQNRSKVTPDPVQKEPVHTEL